MRVLALDSTTRAGSVAVVDDDGILIERMGDSARPHAERLPGDITGLGIALSSIDVFAVASGPGLFTGLRIGIATIQGFAFALGKRVASVSALEALAQLGSRELRPGALVGAWMDAHRRDVFSALYEVTDAELFSDQRLVEIDVHRVDEPAVTLKRWSSLQQPPAVIAGGGAGLYEELIRHAAPGRRDWNNRHPSGACRTDHRSGWCSAGVYSASRRGARSRSSAMHGECPGIGPRLTGSRRTWTCRSGRSSK